MVNISKLWVTKYKAAVLSAILRSWYFKDYYASRLQNMDLEES